jgi:amino acid adenylation domain-containing protein
MATDTAARISGTEDVYSLSAIQESMLSRSLIGSVGGEDLQQLLGEFSEAIDAKAFAGAWEKVVERHGALRTGFQWIGLPRPRQVVHRHLGVPLKQIDWRGLGDAEQKHGFAEWLRTDRLHAFDLSKPPLMRATLFRLRDDLFRFVWTFHHALLDSTAFAIVLGELFTFYGAARQESEVELPPPRPYRDFIDWLGGQDHSQAEGFWRRLLTGFEEPTRLAISRNPGEWPTDGEACAEQAGKLTRQETKSLRALARLHQVTLNTVLQAAWGFLLGRYARTEDVVFGVVRAGRCGAGEGAEGIVGLLINTVPMRVRLGGQQAIGDWLREIRLQQVAVRPFEQTPLLKILEWSSVKPGAPLFETIVNFQEPSWQDRLRRQGADWSQRYFSVRNQPGYPLWLDAHADEELVLKLGYENARFDEKTATRMLEHLTHVLRSLAANPTGGLDDLALMSECERHQVLLGWNRTEAQSPQVRCVQDLFSEQAEQSADLLAAASPGQQLTYRQLNLLANKLADRLQGLGVGPEKPVAICMKRSLELVVAALAVLKAGGVYVPLDPAYPAERLRFMVEDSRAVAVLTRASSGLEWPAGCGESVQVDLGELSEGSDRPNPVHGCGVNNLAYVIYTSGSSGRPKGVAIEHRSLTNLVTWHCRAYKVTAKDRATLLAGPAFDASVWELWPYLAAGASLHIPDEETRLAPKRLIAWFEAQEITLTFLPTPLAEAVLAEGLSANKSLRAVLTGGERLHRRPTHSFGCQLINHYGPTESTVVATAGLVTPGQTEAGNLPPIGQPIANTRAYILDPGLRPMPIGVPGELHVSGAGLAREYLNQARLSVEKFIANPFAEEGYERLYKTGDLARWLPDGNIEFIGRLDQQIKIRGQRVELGEIESVLRQHQAVREAVVVAHDEHDGKFGLTAYIVSTERQKAIASELKEFLCRKLPEYMRPTMFVFLSGLPVTPNGKVDRGALKGDRPEPVPGFVEPRTPAEEMLAAAWCEVLDRRRVGAYDNFFELGGHSLQATQVMSRLRSLFQVELPLHYLFESPTVAGLVERIQAAQANAPGTPAPRLASSTSDEVRVSSAQERIWFLEQLEPGLPLHNIPVAIRLLGTPDTGALERSLTEIVRRHKPLRVVFLNVDGHLTVREEPARPVELPVIDLSRLSAEGRWAEARRIASEQAQAPFDLARSPLLRIRLIRLAEEDHVLVLTMHLIASDGWSIGIFYKELAALYEAFSQNRCSPLPELPIDYMEHARWQREWLQGETLATLLAYWKKQLGGPSPALTLPTDFPRPTVQTFNGATQCFALPQTLAQSLRVLSRQEEVTLFMLLLAAFKILLQHYSGQDIIVVGSPIAGRTRLKTEDLIGTFVNTLVLRTDLSGDPIFTDLLARVRATCLGAYSHQHLPLERLVDALQLNRNASRDPLFQVMFTFQNAPLRPLELVGLELKPLMLDAGIAKFDLTLLMEEAGERLSGSIEYNTDLFAAATITQMLVHFQALLERIAADPERKLSTLTRDLQNRKESALEADDVRSIQPKNEKHSMKSESLQFKPGAIRRRVVRRDAREIVDIKPLLGNWPGPALVEPAVEGVSLPDWARSQKEQVGRLLMEHRAVLFRNFRVESVELFQECVLATCDGELLNYVDRSTPRPAVGNKVYVSTIYPSAETIQMHNEGTYWRTWPLKIYFCSLVTAERGGETPIADVRNVYHRLRSEVREKFLEKKVTYVRNYNDGFGLPWQETFQTKDKAEVEAYCKTNDIEFEWKEGDRLRTRQTRPAIRQHPLTGETVWFNHAAFFHVTSLAPQVRRELLAAFKEQDLPYNTYYGDGKEIEPEIVAEVREAYEQEKVIFPWQNGDVLLLDNMSMAHGRQPYTGKREVVVSMAEPFRAAQ